MQPLAIAPSHPPFSCPEVPMNIFYIIGVVVVIIAILSFLGLA